MDKKRLLIGLGFLVVSVLIGFAIYRFFFTAEPGRTPVTPGRGATTTPGGGFPTAGEGQGGITTPGGPDELPFSPTRDTTRRAPC